MPDLNYAGIMAAGQSLVPDLREQLIQDQQMKMQRAVFQQKEQQFQREQTFRSRLQQVVGSKNPADIHQLMVEFPEFAEQLKPGIEAMDANARKRTLTRVGSVFELARSGKLPEAIAVLQRQHDADAAAGQLDEDTEQLLGAFKSGDPAQIAQAQAALGVMVYGLAGPEKFSTSYKDFNPTEAKSARMREYDERVAKFGKEAADTWLATQDTELVTVEKGGSVYNKADFAAVRPGIVTGYGGGTFNTDGTQLTARDPETGAEVPVSNQRGGDQSAGGGGFAMPVQGGTFTSGVGDSRDGGTRRHNGQDIAAPLGSPVTPIAPGRVVGVARDAKSGKFVRIQHADGSTSSYAHLGQQNVKVGDEVGPGTKLGTVGQTGNATGPVLHLVVRDKSGKIVDPKGLLKGSATVAVRSVQEANALPKGTTYRTPDGRTFVR